MIEFKIGTTQTTSQYIEDNVLIEFTFSSSNLYIWFKSDKTIKFNVVYNIRKPKDFIKFADNANDWLVYKTMSNDRSWDDNGILDVENDLVSFSDGEWSLLFDYYYHPSFIFSDKNSELTFEMSYHIIPEFLEWIISLKDII